MEDRMKNLLICLGLALVGSALIGCGSGDSAPLDPKDQIAEMKAKVPSGLEPVPEDQRAVGTTMMGGGGKKGK
jgi:hypothetical protein